MPDEWKCLRRAFHHESVGNTSNAPYHKWIGDIDSVPDPGPATDSNQRVADETTDGERPRVRGLAKTRDARRLGVWRFMNARSVYAAMAQNTLAFVAGGGDMGALIRAFDWTKNLLGQECPVDAWPEGLRTAVSICLNSCFPIPLW
jgi:hypothetical protein